MLIRLVQPVWLREGARDAWSCDRRACQKAGHLDEKIRELIALAVAITLRCDGCITVHTAAARERGATREEIAETLGVAVSVNAGAAIVYSTRALDAFDAAAEINPNV